MILDAKEQNSDVAQMLVLLNKMKTEQTVHLLIQKDVFIHHSVVALMEIPQEETPKDQDVHQFHVNIPNMDVVLMEQPTKLIMMDLTVQFMDVMICNGDVVVMI
jgi:hypothetical protein